MTPPIRRGVLGLASGGRERKLNSLTVVISLRSSRCTVCSVCDESTLMWKAWFLLRHRRVFKSIAKYSIPIQHCIAVLMDERKMIKNFTQFASAFYPSLMFQALRELQPDCLWQVIIEESDIMQIYLHSYFSRPYTRRHTRSHLDRHITGKLQMHASHQLLPLLLTLPYTSDACKFIQHFASLMLPQNHLL